MLRVLPMSATGTTQISARDLKQFRTMVALADVMVEFIKAHPHGMPNGELYALVMPTGITLENYQFLLNLLKEAGRITESNFLLKAA